MEGGNDNEFHDGDEMIYDIMCVDNELECESQILWYKFAYAKI